MKYVARKENVIEMEERGERDVYIEDERNSERKTDRDRDREMDRERGGRQMKRETE